MAKLLKIDTEKLKNGNYMFRVPEDYRTRASMASWNSDLYSLQYATGMFENNHHLSSFKGNLSKLEDGQGMFYNCVSLTAVDCGNLDRVRYGSRMFAYCYDLKEFPYSLPNLIDGTDMFTDCYLNAASVDKILSYLPSGSGQLDLTCWDDGCEKAAQILGIPKDTCINSYWSGGGGHKKEYKGWKVYLSHKNGGYYIQNGSGGSGNVIVGSGLDKFVYCGTANEVSGIDPDYKSTKYLDGGRWYYNLSNLTNGYEMFYSWSHLTGFYADLHKVNDGEGMFEGCYNLSSFKSSLYNLSSGYRMFAGCNNLTDFYPTQGLANLENGVEMFKGCKLNYSSVHSILSSIPIVTSNNYLTLGMDYTGCEKAAETIGIPNGTRIPNNGDGYQTNYKGWYLYLYAYNHYYIRDNYGSVSSGYDMFANCKTVDEVKAIESNYKSTNYLDNGKWYYNLSNLTNGYEMFYGWGHLTNFEAELYSLQYGSSMFSGCTYLESFNSDLSSLTNGTNMFRYCVNLESFTSDLSSLTNGSGMFYRTNIESFSSDLSSLTNGYIMFANCDNLTTFSSDLSSLTNSNEMFRDCTNLTSFSSDLSSLTNGTNMFRYCVNLESFTSDLSSLTNGSGMFYRTNIESFSSDLSSLTNGERMFSCCYLNAASVQNIADTINTPSSKGMIYIGISNYTPNDQETAAFNKIASKNWTVYVGINGDYPSQWNPTSLTPIDGEEQQTPIPFWAKLVPATEERAQYVDSDGNFYNILGGNYVYGDDLSTYGMFVSEEDAAAQMRLTKYTRIRTKKEKKASH